MAWNILLTSLSAAEHDPPVRYFSLQNEFGFDYCEALLDAEASIKAMLARHSIDEVIVVGAASSYHQGDDLKPAPLSQGSALYSADRASLSTYALLRLRLAQYADELTLDQKEEDALLPEETREKLIRSIQDFQQGDAGLKTKRLNRLFDALAQNDQAYGRFWASLLGAHPELSENQGPSQRWVNGYLYAALKPTAKLELAPINEETCICLIPEDQIDESGQWIDHMMAMERTRDDDEINLYISLNSDDAGAAFIVMNMLDIMVSMPGSGVHLKKIFTVRSLNRCLTGIIRDDTAGFGVTELIQATHSFLNYGKADQIVEIWEKNGDHDKSISSMVYAMRHVDVGLSMCNIPEVEHGILRLRQLFQGEKLWKECGRYGLLFGVIAESIQADYGTLLEGDGEIPFLDLVKWAYRHQFYQQTLTLIETKAPENLVRSGIFYYCADKQCAELVTRLFAQRLLELKPYEAYKMYDIDHYFVKIYDRSRASGQTVRGKDPQRAYAALRTQSVKNQNPALITGFTACDSLETLQNILFAYYHLGEVRNKISHADANAMAEVRLTASESDDSSALVWMRDSIDFFIESYEKAVAEVQNKKPPVVRISAGDVRMTAEHMRYEKRRGGPNA